MRLVKRPLNSNPIARLGVHRGNRDAIPVHASTLDRQLKRDVVEIIRFAVGAPHHLVDKVLKQGCRIGRDTRLDDHALDARVLKTIDEAAQGWVVAVLIPRRVIGEPRMPQFMQCHADKLRQGLFGDDRVVIDVGEHEPRRQRARTNLAERNRCALAAPLNRDFAERPVGRIEDTLQRGRDPAFEI